MDQSIQLVRNHFRVLIGIACVVSVPFTLLRDGVTLLFVPDLSSYASEEEVALSTGENLGFIFFDFTYLVVFEMLLWPLLNAGIFYAINQEYLGHSASVKHSLMTALRLWKPLLVTGALAGAYIFIGLLLFIIPGLILILRFSLITQVVLLEHKTGPAALMRSAELTRGNMGTGFALIFMVFTLYIIPGALGEFIPLMPLLVLFHAFHEAILAVFEVAAFVVFYFHCRCKNEHYDLQLLAKSVGNPTRPVSVEGSL